MAVSEDPSEPQASDVEKSGREGPGSEAQDLPQVTEPATEKSWKTEEQILPKNNLPLVFFSLLLTTFLAALDQTIVATALPTIVAQLQGGQNYSWVGSAYLLASAALSPFYGKISDILGRKAVLYPIIVIFLVGSALCGAAKSMTWLIVARAIQGIGGGGIFQMVNIVIGDIVPLEKRATFGGYAGALWGIASIIGPLIGGALTDHVSWRWCFWVNLPTGGVALGFLFFTLHLNPLQQKKPLQQHIKEFDFLGLFLLVSGVVCVLMGFDQSEITWDSAATISLLVIGFVLLVFAGWWECYTTRSPIIPPRLFKTRTTTIILVTSFLHGLTFFNGSFYLPVYYQVLGASATRAGIQMLPFSLSTCFVSLVSGFLIARIGDSRQIMGVSFAVMALGFGLMIMLDEASSVATQVIYPLLAGLGIGGLFVPPLIALQAAMPGKDMATSTATYGLLRQLGSTIGVSIGQAIWSSELRKRITHLPLPPSLSASSGSLADSIRLINTLQPLSLRHEVQHAYTRAIALIWVVDTPLVGVCLLMVFFMKTYSIKRPAIHVDSLPDAEAQPVSEKDQAMDQDKFVLSPAPTLQFEKPTPGSRDDGGAREQEKEVEETEMERAETEDGTVTAGASAIGCDERT